MECMGPIEVDRGYFEFRVNWSASDLMAMSGAMLERLKELIVEWEALAALATHLTEAVDAVETER
jgi:hypothetical protein